MRRLSIFGSNPPKNARLQAIALSLATGIALALALAGPTALADTEIQEEGRQIRTGPKQVQRDYNGIPLDPSPEEVSEGPSGRRLTTAGRELRAEPTQRVSVGIIGCPGCAHAVEAVGGVVVDHRVPQN